MKRERGFILLFTFIIMLTLTVLVSAFLYMISTKTLGSGGGTIGSQAFWLTEAGIQRTLNRIKTSASFRASPTGVTGCLGAGSYSVTTSKSGDVYTMTSTGTVKGLNRKVIQTAKIRPASLDYAIFGNTNANQLKLKNTVSVVGDLFYDGNVKVENNASVTGGLVYADNVTGGGAYTEAGSDPDPVPVYPAFSTTTYDNAITTAESTASSNLNLGGSSNLNLAGGTVYYKNVTVKNNATVTGPGTIVATKEVVLKNSANIGSNVTIITKKNITAQNSAVVQSESILYGKTGVTLKDSANVTGSLLVPENNKQVTVKDSAVMTGFIYGDEVNLRGSASVIGTVNGNKYNQNKITGSVTVTYSEASIPSTLPTGLASTVVTVIPQKDWDEVAP